MKAKGVKSVKSRVCNLKELNSDVTVEAMKFALCEAFEEEYGAFEKLEFVEDAKELYETYKMYASWDWRYGKSPECEIVHSKRFTWGEVEVHLKLKNLYIEECKVYSDALDVELPGLLEQLIINQRYDMQGVHTEKKELKEVITWLGLLH
jgi:lipoate-protein ligase A